MVETRSGRRFAIFFFVAAFLMFFLGRWIAPINHVAMAAAAPFQAAISTVANGAGDAVSGVFDGPRLRDENQKLKNEVATAIQQNILLQEQRSENQKLRRMLKFQEPNPQLGLLVARVIATDPNSLAPYIIISKGSRDGLRRDMTVLDHHGYFVGSISDLTANASKVQLMLNPSSSVGAMDLQTRAKGLVEGQFDAQPKLDNVVVSSVIRRGDLVVTSGNLNLYPRTILMGQVASVRHRNFELFQTAELKPAADFRDLEMVQVVRSFVPNKPSKLVTGP